MPDDNNSWPHLDAYERARSKPSSLPRKSLLKFGSFSDAILSLAKIGGQSFISWFLFIMLLIVLVEATNESDQYFLAANEVVKLFCYTISVFLAARIFDETEIRDLGLRFGRLAIQDFLVGFGVILLLFALTFALDLGSGAIRIQGRAWEAMTGAQLFWNIVLILVIFLFTGWSEELLARGYYLRVLSKGFNRPLGIVLSAVGFAYLHHNNPDMTPGTYVLIFFSGIVFALAFLWSGNLWLPMGLHAGWDFFVTLFWGVPISGLRIFHLFNVQVVPGVALPTLVRDPLEWAVILSFVYFYTRRRHADIKDW